MSGAYSEKSKSVELWLVFGTEKSTSSYICVPGNYQPETAANIAVNTPRKRWTFNFGGQETDRWSFLTTQTMKITEELLQFTLGGHPRWRSYCIFFRKNERWAHRVAVSGKKMQLMPEQISMKWIKVLVFKFYKAEHPLLDTCAGTLATTDTCLQLLKNGRFCMLWEGRGIYQVALPSFVEIYAKHFLFLELEVVLSGKAVETRKVFVKETTAIPSNRKADR